MTEVDREREWLACTYQPGARQFTLRAVLVGMLREARAGRVSSRKDGDTMNRLMRVTLLTFVVSLVVWG